MLHGKDIAMRSLARLVGRAAVTALCVSLLDVPQLAAQENSDDPPFPAAESVIVDGDGAVELHVVDMPLATVLRMLSVQGRKNIIATPAVEGTVTADLYNVTFDQALRAVLVTNNCDHRMQGDFIYVYTREELADMQAAATPVASRVYRLNYIRAVDVVAAIAPLMSDDGKISQSPDAEAGLEIKLSDVGGDSYAHQDFIVVHDYPERLDAIGELLRTIDVQPLQVLVEATILRARLTDDNALGVDFSLVGGVDLELLGGTSIGVQNLSVGALPTDRFEKFNSTATTDFASNVPDGGFTLGIIKDHVAVFLRALEQITDTSVIANPKVIALNKQSANIIVGRRDGYITTTVTETQAVQKVEFLETGTQLTFRPFIGTDSFVRMELHPEDSVGGLTAAQLPFEQTTEVTTNVIVRDGHTILIGGLFREVGSESRSQLPLLGDVPWLGDLFRSKNDSLDREEVIILLTVRIIDNHERYAELSAQARDDIELSRVSLRRSAMWHSRERIAQSHYRSALDLQAQGQNALALWNARMAVHNHPRFVSAIKLVQEIQQADEWEDNTGVASDFIDNLIDNDPRGADR